MSEPAYGPWSSGIDEVERVAQLRCLACATHLLLRDRELVAELRRAETDPGALRRSLEMVEKLPSLRRRHLLSVFSTVCWPPRRRVAA
jgi:hypothetical protein